MLMRLNYEIICYFMMKDRILVMEINNLLLLSSTHFAFVNCDSFVDEEKRLK